MPPKKKKKKVVLEDDDRFDFIDDDAYKRKRESLQKTNTIKADKKAHKVFTTWLTVRKLPLDYWNFSVNDLNKHLSKFWFEARTIEGEHYKTTSLGALRYGINHTIQSKDRDIDIVHGSEFKKSSTAFSDACKELKALGKGNREHYKEIIPQGKIKFLV